MLFLFDRNLDILTDLQLGNALKNFSKFRTDDSHFTSLYKKVPKVCNEQYVEIPSVKKKKINDSNSTQYSADKKIWDEILFLIL